MENLEDRNFNGERERRSKRRFPIDQEVKYKMLYGQRIAETGTGRTMNLSSGGIRFSTENMLPSGVPVELSLGWPVLLNDSCPMKLTVYGSVVRSHKGGAAGGHRTLRVPHLGSRRLPAAGGSRSPQVSAWLAQLGSGPLWLGERLHAATPWAASRTA